MSEQNLPPWVDWKKVEQGQNFYQLHMAPASLVLFNLSLVGGFSSPIVDKVLESTGYLSVNTKATYKRLMETAQMIQDCTRNVKNLHEGEIGWQSALRVRLLHAYVRYRLRNSPDFDVEAWGVPINQEDMIVTQLSFSCLSHSLSLSLTPSLSLTHTLSLSHSHSHPLPFFIFFFPLRFY